MTGFRADFVELGLQFAQLYYSKFDVNRESVLEHYHPQALMTFEDNQGQGHDQLRVIITEKMKFQKIQHAVTKIDSQPTYDGGVIVVVSGRLKTDEDPPHAFSQTFVLRPDNNNMLITHDVFRLSLHNTV